MRSRPCCSSWPPTAPHLTEELWSRKGYPYSIHNQAFPKWNEALAAEEEVTLVIQVNGKLRDKVAVPVGVSEEEAKELALKRDRIKVHLNDKDLVNVIYVPGRLVNIVAR